MLERGGMSCGAYICINTSVLVIIHGRSGPEVVDGVSKTLDAFEAEDLVEGLKVIGLGWEGLVNWEARKVTGCSSGFQELCSCWDLWEALPRQGI